MLRCNIRAIKRGKKRMKRNKVLRGGPEPLIFFSLMHRASCHAAFLPFSRIPSRLLIHPISHSFALFRLSAFTLAHVSSLYVVNVPSTLSFTLTHSFEDWLLLSLHFLRLDTAIFVRFRGEQTSSVTVLARRVLQGKRIERWRISLSQRVANA